MSRASVRSLGAIRWQRVGVGLFLGIAVSLAAQSPAQTAAAPSTFAAVSIKEYQRGTRGVFRVGQTFTQFQADPAGFHALDENLRGLILLAYGMDVYQLSGGIQPWMYQMRYDVDAATVAPATNAQELKMLQSVLRDRFGLRLEIKTVTKPVLELVVAPGGVKFHELSPDRPPNRNFSHPLGEHPFAVTNVQTLILMLNWPVMSRMFKDRAVVDKTGLTGRYEIQFALPQTRFTSPRADGALGRTDMSKFPAELAKLGLDLKPATDPVTYYTITNAHPPTFN